MQVEYYKKDKLLLLKITEEIDHHSSEKIRKRSDYEIQIHIPKKVVFDFNNVTFMDSSGIGMLIGRYKLVSMFRRNSYTYKCKTNRKENITNVRSIKNNTNRRK